MVLVLFVMMGAVALYAHRAREDIYPLAAVLASFMVVSLVWMGDVTESWNEGMLLVMAIWLIVSSTTAGLLLASTARNWREEATT